MTRDGGTGSTRRRRFPFRRKRTRLQPLDNNGVLWIAAIDRVPIEDRIVWVEKMKRQVDAINAGRAR